MEKVALVTGANQGLGLALVRGLCAAFGPGDTVYLTARDPRRGRAAVDAIGAVAPTLRFEQLDVTDDDGVSAVADRIRDRHGGIDVVIANAAARIARERPAAEQVAVFIDTNNLGTTRMLRRFVPILRNDGRFVVVASSFGRLDNLPADLRDRFEPVSGSLDDIDAVMRAYVDAVTAGVAAADGWPDWINVPSKVGQVAAARLAARAVAAARPADGILVNAVCPGLIDTEASRPWFADMSQAQSPEQAAVDVLWLALLPAGTRTPHGELVRHRDPLIWSTGVACPDAPSRSGRRSAISGGTTPKLDG